MRSANLLVWGAIPATVALLGVAACVSHQASLRMEPKSVARQLGVANCRVSAPVTQEEMLRQARLDGIPEPETRQEWTDMVARIQPGDQLRVVNCVAMGSQGLAVGNYCYALFRGSKAVVTLYDITIN